MIAQVKTTQSTRSRRGQKQAGKPDFQEYLKKGATLAANASTTVVAVGARVICRRHPHAMDDWIVEKITAKLVHVFSPSINQRARLRLEQIELYAPEKAFPIFQSGDRVKNISELASSTQKDIIFTVTGRHQNGMTSLEDDDGISFSLHCSELALATPEDIAPLAQQTVQVEPEKPAFLFVNEGDRVRGRGFRRGKPIIEGIVVSLGKELVELNTGRVYLAGIEIIEQLQDQSALSQLTALLAGHGFNSLGHSSQSGHADEDLESYEDWEIFVDFPNGGAIGVDLIHRATCGWWRMFDEDKFDYRETEEATAWAKTVVDRVEHNRRVLSGQLSLLEPAPVESDQFENKLAVQPAEQLTELAPELAIESTLDQDIDRLYREATESEETAFNAGKAALQLYRELGQKLEQRKAETKHGGWLPYLQEHNIQERKAQRAMAIARSWDALIKSDSVTDLTLTEALDKISIKKLPTVDQDEQDKKFKLVCVAYDSVYPGGFKENSSGGFPFIFEAPGFRKTFSSLDDALKQHLKIWQQYDRYTKSNPLPTSAPTLEEIKDYYAQVGTVKDWGKGFCVERDDVGPPFPLGFNNAKTAWAYWEQNGARLLEIAQRKPMSSEVYEEAQEAELSELEAVDAVATVVPNVPFSAAYIASSAGDRSGSITAQQIHAIATDQVTSTFEKLSSMGVDVAAIVEMADVLENSIREILEENLLKDS
ncbi:MAG: hypothetical protein KME11_05210 [Timaviella obliquedivisa GSE-PSE-MK23-08B]|jgi:hypothetical protein|nr:hypothetical protein [Timaviella obliquedivisa GSE-PSE-MK23-08B]